jgi:hypothetical protein
MGQLGLPLTVTNNVVAGGFGAAAGSVCAAGGALTGRAGQSQQEKEQAQEQRLEQAGQDASAGAEEEAGGDLITFSEDGLRADVLRSSRDAAPASPAGCARLPCPSGRPVSGASSVLRVSLRSTITPSSAMLLPPAGTPAGSLAGIGRWAAPMGPSQPAMHRLLLRRGARRLLARPAAPGDRGPGRLAASGGRRRTSRPGSHTAHLHPVPPRVRRRSLRLRNWSARSILTVQLWTQPSLVHCGPHRRAWLRLAAPDFHLHNTNLATGCKGGCGVS